MAKRAKKHKKHEEHIPESWLIPYADILTLLLALFIVLFASSSVDTKKLAELSNVFNTVFDGGSGIMKNPSMVEVKTPKSNLQEQSAYEQDQESLKEIESDVEEFIANNELEDQFNTKMTEDGLLVTIKASVLFEPGRADIRGNYSGIAKDLSKVLNLEPKRSVVVAGYTDSVPAQSAEFKSNWELSVMRAVNFLTLLIDSNKKLDSAYFSAKGYGENNPVASNDTEEGKAKNRRVEVLIQPLVKKDGSSYEQKNK
ncbi:flagellar motor protein MotB [Kurthia sibirica]|uniref:Flagellar motor protein MotB n=1 Tax=Kurthia sibirica TaxID=202750 RepID=A0A2U3AL77_9BACL|nr:flagellar motor protein MotB [Kurthia sibirica]PWI25290.1 flagellar motor protein MotB [Kurthia sibirica]GEK34652.1 motility protein B [Kurthia sibirica]